jgi:hypothetical protein
VCDCLTSFVNWTMHRPIIAHFQRKVSNEISLPDYSMVYSTFAPVCAPLHYENVILYTVWLSGIYYVTRACHELYNATEQNIRASLLSIFLFILQINSASQMAPYSLLLLTKALWALPDLRYFILWKFMLLTLHATVYWVRKSHSSNEFRNRTRQL